jgi:hypothetical protein
MAKSQKNQTFVLKINTGYLSKNGWHLTLKLSEIRKQPQLVVSLGSSQVLRWLEQEQCKQNNDLEATRIKQEIKYIKKQENSIDNKRENREKLFHFLVILIVYIFGSKCKKQSFFQKFFSSKLCREGF